MFAPLPTFHLGFDGEYPLSVGLMTPPAFGCPVLVAFMFEPKGLPFVLLFYVIYESKESEKCLRLFVYDECMPLDFTIELFTVDYAEL